MKVKVAQSCLTLCDPMDHTVHGILQARKLEWGAFPFSRGSSQPRNRIQVSHTADGFFISHKGSWRTLEWVAYPFSRGSSQPRNWTGVSCIAGRFFTNWAIRERLAMLWYLSHRTLQEKKTTDEGPSWILIQNSSRKYNQTDLISILKVLYTMDKWYLFLQCKDASAYEHLSRSTPINTMWGNYMIISVNIEKAFDKIQHSFMDHSAN